ncbi:MAG TPA: GNAT family N-acetyltransferase [Myxococcota bacterium]|nr:GNAT family N-acetyltransferase [Myxococcota bacterium]
MADVKHLPAVPPSSKGAFVVYPDGKNDGERLAEMTYTHAGDTMVIIDHTYVSDVLKGQGVGKQLVLAGVAWLRETGLKVIPLCPFAKSVFDRSPELADVLA